MHSFRNSYLWISFFFRKREGRAILTTNFVSGTISVAPTRYPYRVIQFHGSQTLSFIPAAIYNRVKRFPVLCPLPVSLPSPHRTAFLSPETVCNIAPGTNPPGSRNGGFFGTSVRDSPPRIFPSPDGSEPVPLYAENFRHTKVLALRGGGVPESRHLNYQIDDNHEKKGSDARQRQIPESTGIISNSRRKRISALSRCFVKGWTGA